MASKNFLLLSLEDAKTRKIANVVGNQSCRKILDYLSTKEATESELAEKLQIPISTVHYNLQQLMETGLITAEEYHYSEKGKEVNHYKLANKYIIITPKSTWGIKEKLKSILPVALIVGAAAIVLQYFQRFFVRDDIVKTFIQTKQTLVRETFITQKAAESADVLKEAATAAIPEVIEKAEEEAVRAAPSAAQEVVNRTTEYMLRPEVTTETIKTATPIWQNIALWFLVGALFALTIYFIISLYRKDMD